MKKYVKIISPDVRFARMLALEMSDLGIDVISEAHNGGYDGPLFILADLDHVTQEEIIKASDIGSIIGYSRTYDQKTEQKAALCQAFLHRPFLMGDLTDLFDTTEKQHKQKPRKPHKKADILTVDETTGAALFGETRIPVSTNEYKLLKLLCDRRGETVLREEIDDLLEIDGGNMGDVYICHLRRKIDNKLGLKLIYTVRGKGYMLK